jgi:fibronectin-binding autotransporter adhesin
MKNHDFLPQNLSRGNWTWTPFFTLAFLLGLLAPPAALAQISTWTGGGTQTPTTGWSQAANWGGTALASGNALVFQGSTGLANGDDIGGALSVGGLTFASGAGAFTMGSTSGDSIVLTFAAAITDNSSTSEIISLPITLSAVSQTVHVVGGGSLTISGLISGASDGLALSGSGTLTLTGAAAGANTYTGATSVQGGTLALDFTQGGSTPVANIISSSSALTLGGNLAVKSASGSTAQTFASMALAGSSQVSASGTGVPTVTFGTFTVGTGANVVFNGPVSPHFSPIY